MSNIYIQEPPCSGKVCLKTTVGDIDIELWSKEAPKACRNFVQLCLEGYYNGTVFHRVIKGFIAQGGDPNGDGTGGESIYGAPFKDEFHSRLRFVRRGLVAMANSEKDDNGSQFFFTLGQCPELQNKHTIFGRVAGDTVFNMMKLEDCMVDENDRPQFPHRIISSKILVNPFDDIVPRTGGVKVKEEPVPKPKEKTKRNLKLLSFGEEAEEEEIEVNSVAEKYRGKGKSSHDLTNDPLLSSVSALPLYENNAEDDSSQKMDNIRKKLKRNDAAEAKKAKLDSDSLSESVSSVKKDDEYERAQIRKQIKELKKDLKGYKTNEAASKQVLDSEDKGSDEILDNDNPLLADFHKQSVLYRNKSKNMFSDSTDRTQKTLEMLEKFKEKLQKANTSFEDSDDERKRKKHKKNSWLAHEMRCDEEAVTIAKDASLPSAERYDLTDPRNPLNQRRRLESKKKQRAK